MTHTTEQRANGLIRLFYCDKIEKGYVPTLDDVPFPDRERWLRLAEYIDGLLGGN